MWGRVLGGWCRRSFCLSHARGVYLVPWLDLAYGVCLPRKLCWLSGILLLGQGHGCAVRVTMLGVMDVPKSAVMVDDGPWETLLRTQVLLGWTTW